MPGKSNDFKILLANQPVYSANKELFGFELLFRHEDNLSVDEFGDDLATSDVLLNLCTGITREFDVYSRPLFINLTERFLLSEIFLPIPAQGVIIDLPGSVAESAAVVAAIKNWRSKGFKFALDGFDFDVSKKGLLALVDYAKINVLEMPYQQVAAEKKKFSGAPLTWVAERVESEEQFLQFKELGFGLFQGYFLARPKLVEGYAIRGKIHNSVVVINALNQPDIDIDKLTAVVSKDPALATQILKIINSPACALLRTINSLKDAITYLGIENIRKWAIMIAMVTNCVTNQATVRMVMTRAKACENYAENSIFVKPDQAFLVGLLSGVQMLFGVQNEIFMNKVLLGKEIMEAVLRHSGYLGQILSEVISIEKDIMQSPRSLRDRPDTAVFAFQDAAMWAEMALATFR